MDEKEFRVLIKYCFLKGKNIVEAKAWLDAEFTDTVPGKSTIKECCYVINSRGMFPKTSAFCGDWKCFIRMASGWINVARGLNYTKVVAYLYEPRDPSSLGIIRFLFGMFPYVCLATLPLFCKEDWPRKIWHFLLRKSCNTKETTKEVSSATTKPQMITKKQKLVVGCLFLHMFLQIFLPYSHFITQGFNTWTNGLYGYSWDMMVHSWHSILVVIKVVDNESGQEHFMDENAWTLSNRWNKYGDMSVQYAQCIKKNFNAISSEDNTHSKPHISQDISIYVDVWCSMNERFQQRMFNPNYNLLQANWSVFRPVEWMLPLMVQYDGFRKQIADITKHVHSWNNESDVAFIADFPAKLGQQTSERYSHTEEATILLLRPPSGQRRKIQRCNSVVERESIDSPDIGGKISVPR
ncbi:hypothetical protein GWI33_019193 [Rhynchophorus ferrugineus]|uniref:Vitamin K-dependent gamma-carboxylase lumenal domain-containing protein n=1 Tax=Rhynchophorus ferrugineus TaxID=354439 RepID=A0A834HRX9_RHYFE|nr:hypothetical protein GWI33_019193 [Rhynchophorus ferrugineus]